MARMKARLKVEIDPQSLDCSLCLETVTDPRILPCGHTFCGLKSPDNCLQKLDPRNNGTIKCPICQTDHQIRVADVPPDIKCKEMLESLGLKKQGRIMCRKHNKKIVMRCITDGKEDKQLKCRRRKDFFRKASDYFDNQRLQEDSLDNQLGNLKTRRDAITRKLASDNFYPDDEDVMVLKEYVDHLEATSDFQQEASEDIRERSQQLIELVDSRAPTYCQNINKNPVPTTKIPTTTPETIPETSIPEPPITIPTLISRMIFGPSKRPTGAAQMPTASKGGSTSRQAVGRRTLTEENASCTTNIVALGEWGKHYILGLKDNRWEEWKGKRDDFYYGFGAICHQEKVYIIGGCRRGRDYSPNVDIFHIGESKWTDGPELNIPREGAAACFVESQRSIYICGGSKSYETIDALNSVEKLELDENGIPVGEWREVTPMKEKRTGCAAVAVGTQMFVTGGQDQKTKFHSSVEIFDTETNEWRYGPEMKEFRCDHAVEHYDGVIYAMGGSSGNDKKDSCEKLDLQNWTWTTIESNRVPRSSFGSIVANGKFYVVGGFTEGRKEDDERGVEVYDPVTNKWSRGSRLPESLGYTQCVCW